MTGRQMPLRGFEQHSHSVPANEGPNQLSLNLENRRIKQQLEMVTKEREILTDELRESQAKLRAQQGENMKMSQRIQSLDFELATLRTERDRFREETTQFRQQILNLEAHVSQQNSQFNDSVMQNDILRNQLSQMS